MTQLKRILFTKAALGIALGGFLLVNVGVLAPNVFAGMQSNGNGHNFINPGDGLYYCVCNWTPVDCAFCN